MPSMLPGTRRSSDSQEHQTDSKEGKLSTIARLFLREVRVARRHDRSVVDQT